MKKIMKFSAFVILMYVSQIANAQVLLEEGFEPRTGYTGGLPPGWSFKYEVGTYDWKFQKGGNRQFPDTAASGAFNACFNVESYSSERTKLLTPSLDLRNISQPRLRFKHVQKTWTIGANKYTDELRVYYKTSFSGEWKLVPGGLFNSPVEQWTERTILLDPSDVSASYYIAFEGKTNYGYGTCIDDVIVDNANVEPLYVNNVMVEQASTMFMASGSTNNPILKINISVSGNTNSLTLQTLMVTSLNSFDGDLSSSGVKIFKTSTDVFNDLTMVGSAQNFSSGTANFTLNTNLAFGDNFFWVTYDLNSNVDLTHTFDARIAANAITISGNTFPATGQSPEGFRNIFQTIFSESFESASGWDIVGFEIGTPTGRGGNRGGEPDPSFAAKGTKVLGNGLSGITEDDFNYLPNLTTKQHYAVSPSITCTYLKDVRLRFQRWLNIEKWDSASIDVSVDGMLTWIPVWESKETFYNDNRWSMVEVDLASIADRKPSLNVRFTLGATNASTSYSGWNIDDLVITANYLENDLGVTDLILPKDKCGFSSAETFAIKVHNFSAIPSNDTIPVGFSLDGGATYTRDTIFGVIPVGGDTLFTFKKKANVSAPKYYTVVARTLLAKDEDLSNDISEAKQLFSIPTRSLPYTDDFETSNGFWTAGGNSNATWQWGKPNSYAIKTASSGYKAWKTNLINVYELNDSSTVTSPCYDFTAVKYPVFDFKMNTQMDSTVSGAQLQYSTDQGLTWHTVPTTQKKWNWYNVDKDSALIKTFATNPAWADSTRKWVQAKNFLPASVAGKKRVKFRFIFASRDRGPRGDGFAFDDVKIYNVPPDLGILSFRMTKGACELSDAEAVKVTIANYGIDTLAANTVVNLGLILNNANPVLEAFTLPAKLNPGDTIQYTFSHKLDLSHQGIYKLRAFTKMAGDINFYGNSNDSAYHTVEVYGMPDFTLGPDFGSASFVELDAGPGYTSYYWEKDSTRQKYMIDSWGTYSVTVTNSRGCTASDDVYVFESVEDLSVTNLTGLSSACDITSPQSLSCVINNLHNEVFVAGSKITVAYSINGNTPVIEQTTLTDDFTNGETLDYTFAQKLDLTSKGIYNIKCYTILAGDINRKNDTSYVTIEEYGFADVELGSDTIKTKNPSSVTLDAGPNFQSYLWSDGSTQRTMNVQRKSSSKYYVTATAFHGCLSDVDSVVVTSRDLRADSLVWPVTSCDLTSSEHIKIKITNTSTDTILAGTRLPVNYLLSGHPTTRDTCTLAEDLLPDSSAIIVFPSTIDLSVVDDYVLSASIAFPHDIDATNNSVENFVQVKSKPVFDLGPDTLFLKNPVGTDLKAYSLGATYLWSNNATSSSITIYSANTARYSVTATKNGCSFSDSILVWTKDLTVIGIDTVFSLCEIENNAHLKVKIQNSCTDKFFAGEKIVVGVSVDNAIPSYDTLVLAQTVYPSDLFSLRLSSPIDISEIGSHSITSFLVSKTDVDKSNDTAINAFTIYGYPNPKLVADTIETTKPDTIELRFAKTYNTYKWSNGSKISTDPVYDITYPYSKTYTVTVTIGPNCSGGDTLTLITKDLAINYIDMPIDKCTGIDNDSVLITYSNEGLYPIPAGDTIFFDMQCNSISTTDTVILDTDIPVGGFGFHTFGKRINTTSKAVYNLSVAARYYREAYPDNNTLHVSVNTWGLPPAEFGYDTIATLSADTLSFSFGLNNDISYYYNGVMGNNNFSISSRHTARYTVKAISSQGCENADTLYVLANDIGINKLLHPVSSCVQPENDSIIVEITNAGADTLAAFTPLYLSAMANNILVSTDTITLDSVLKPDQKITHVFRHYIAISGSDSTGITLFLGGKPGVEPGNDTLRVAVLEYGLPSFSLGADTILTTMGDTVQITAPAGFKSYDWVGGSTVPYYNVPSRSTALYTVAITDTNGCINTDSVLVLNQNIGIDSVVTPYNQCTFDSINPVTISVRNNGDVTIKAGTPVFVSVVPSELSPLYDTAILAADLLKGASQIITTKLNIDLRNHTSYTLSASVSSIIDATHTDDTSHSTIVEWGVPSDVLAQDYILTTRPDTVILTTNSSAFTNYLWDNTSSSVTYNVPSGPSGYHYVKVTDKRGCVGSDSVMITSGDLGLGAILNPDTSCIHQQNDSVVVEIVNYGGDAFPASTKLNVELLIDGTSIASETFSTPVALAAGARIPYTFANRINIGGRSQSTIEVKLHGKPGINESNDTARKTVIEYGVPDVSISVEKQTAQAVVFNDTCLTIEGSKISLNVKTGYEDYQWNSGASTDVFDVPSNKTAWYIVTVTDYNGCHKSDSIYVLNADLELSSIVNPVDSCIFTGKEQLGILIKNLGDVAVPANTPLFLTINRGATVMRDTMRLSSPLSVGASRVVTANKTIDLTGFASAKLKATIASTYNANTYNDTLSKVVVAWGDPSQFLQFDTIRTIDPLSVVLKTKSVFASYAWNDGSTNAQNNVVSEGNGTYTLTVTNSKGCKGTDSTVLITNDLSLGKISHPVNACVQPLIDSITTQIINTGHETYMAGTLLYLSALVNNLTVSVDTVALWDNALPGDTLTYTFKNKISLAGIPSSQIKASFTRSPGVEPSNDATQETVVEYGLPTVSIGNGKDTILTTMADTLVLEVNKGLSLYAWNTGSDSSSTRLTSKQSALYSAMATDANGCSNSDSLMVFNNNISLSSILSPVNACALSSSEELTMRVTNTGDITLPALTKIHVKLSVDGGTSIADTISLPANLDAGSFVDLRSSATLDLAGRSTSSIQAEITMANDARYADNSLTKAVNEWGFPTNMLAEDTIKTSLPELVILTTTSDFASYLWDGTETTPGYTLKTDGKHYVEVIDSVGCKGSDSVFVIVGDLALSNIISPLNTCLTAGSHPVSLALKNVASKVVAAGSAYTMNLIHDGVLIATDTIVLTTQLNQGDSLIHTFSKQLTLTGDLSSNIQAFLVSSPDFNQDNDTSTIVLLPFGKPSFSLASDTILVARATPTALSIDQAFQKYEWTSGATTNRDTITVNSSGYYFATVTAYNGCRATDSVYLFNRDISVADILSPASSCIKTAPESVVVAIKNTGDVLIPAGERITISAAINTKSPQKETVSLSRDLHPGDTIHMSPAIVLSTNETPNTNISISVNASRGDFGGNNTTQKSIREWGNPSNLFDFDSVKTSRPDTIALNPRGTYVSYLWNDGSTDSSLAPNNGTGFYQVTVTDTNGCKGTDMVFVLSGDLGINAILSPTSLCSRANDFSVSVELANGGPALRFGQTIKLNAFVGDSLVGNESIVLTRLINTGETFTHTFAERIAYTGNYPFDLTVLIDQSSFPNANDTARSTIVEYGLPNLDLGNDTIITSMGDTLKLIAPNTFAAYIWSTGDDTSFVVPTNESRTYTLVVTDANGCKATDSVAVLNQDLLLEGISSPQSGCAFDAPEELVLNVTNNGDKVMEPGSKIIVAHTVNGISSTDTISLPQGIEAGQSALLHTGLLVDLTYSDSTIITVDARLVLDANLTNGSKLDTIVEKGVPLHIFDTDTIISSRPDTLTLTTTKIYESYLWDNGSTDVSRKLTVFAPSLYKVTVSDANGCTATDSVFVFSSHIAVSQLISPTNMCQATSPVDIIASIANHGQDTIAKGTRLILNITINSLPYLTDTVETERILVPGASQIITASKTFDATLLGNNHFSIALSGVENSTTVSSQYNTIVDVWAYPTVNIAPRHIFTSRPDTLHIATTGNATSWLWSSGDTTSTCKTVDGKTKDYVVRASSMNGCTALDTVTVVTKFVSVKVLSPIGKCAQTASEKIILRLINTGTDAITANDELELRMVANDTSRFNEIPVINGTLFPGDSVTFTSSKTIDATRKTAYSLSAAVYSSYANIRYKTDSVRQSFTHYGYPQIQINNGADTIRTSQAINIGVTPGYATYKWNDGSTAPQMLVTSSGTKRVTVASPDGCASYDSVVIVGKNISLSGIQAPAIHLCITTASGNVAFNISNTGLDTLEAGTKLSATYSVTNGSSTTESVTLASDLAPGSSQLITMARKYNFTLAKAYSLNFSIVYPGDIDTTDNKLTQDITVFTSPSITFGENFDTISVQFPYNLQGPPGYQSYAWSNSATTSSISIDQPGAYTLSVTDKNGCQASRKIVLLNTSGTYDNWFVHHATTPILLYPNPASEHVTVETIDGKIITRITVLNNQKVAIITFNKIGNPRLELPLYELADGFYFLAIEVEGETIIAKLVKH